MDSDIFHNAYIGSLVADAVSMPVHWYYDREALRAEYGAITGYLAPKNPHTGSILWRSHYEAPNERGEILHDQAAYWGQRGVHYHQFLKAGENTLNFRLAAELVNLCGKSGGYDPDEWLAHYIAFMLTPGMHRDTYLRNTIAGSSPATPWASLRANVRYRTSTSAASPRCLRCASSSATAI